MYYTATKNARSARTGNKGNRNPFFCFQALLSLSGCSSHVLHISQESRPLSKPGPETVITASVIALLSRPHRITRQKSGRKRRVAFPVWIASFGDEGRVDPPRMIDHCTSAREIGMTATGKLEKTILVGLYGNAVLRIRSLLLDLRRRWTSPFRTKYSVEGARYL